MNKINIKRIIVGGGKRALNTWLKSVSGQVKLCYLQVSILN